MIAVENKYALTIDEASQYFNVGQKKLRSLVKEHLDTGDWILMVGQKCLIKKQKFELFLDKCSSI